MLTLVATLLAELGGGLARVMSAALTELPGAWRSLPGLLLFMALVTGLVCLLLTPLVYRFRRVPPPTVITVWALVVSVTPLVIVVVGSLR